MNEEWKKTVSEFTDEQLICELRSLTKTFPYSSALRMEIRDKINHLLSMGVSLLSEDTNYPE